MTNRIRLDSNEFREANVLLERSSASEAIQWGFETFGNEIALATGFGPSGVVLMDLVSRIRPGATVFYLDTGFLFEETYRLRDELSERLGLTIEQVSSAVTPEEQEAVYGPALWEREPDRCCAIRKVHPLREFMRGRSAWITGIRRDQSGARREIDIVDWDVANQAYKLCPLATWTSADVWSYIRLHELPYNELHERGFPSIGCTHCTRPVRTGENERAGRWAGLEKTECGIHLQSQIAA